MTAEYDRPAKGGDPEKLLSLCEILREGDLPRDELYEEAEYSKRITRDNVRYGLHLGFIEETPDSIVATPLGVEASYNQDSSNELALQFREGIKNYPLYSELLDTISSDEEPDQDDIVIIKSDVLKALRTSFGLEGSESSLSEVSTTFLKTLQAAGFGDYFVGRKSKKTRLEAVEEFHSLLSEVNNSMKEDDIGRIEGSSSPENPSPAESKVQPQPVQMDGNRSGSEFHISLDITGDDDPEQVEKLILAVRRGLSVELGEAEDSMDVQELNGDERTKEDQEAEENEWSEEEEESLSSSDSSLDTFREFESENHDKSPSESGP